MVAALAGVLLCRVALEGLGLVPRPSGDPRPAWVVPPGHETEVMRLVRPAIERGVSGRAVSRIEIEGAQIRLALEGGGAVLLSAEGRLEPSLTTTFSGVDVDGAIREAFVGRPVPDLFVRPEPGRVDAEDDARDGTTVGSGVGLLGPASRMTGLPPPALIGSAWLVALLLFVPFLRTLPRGVEPQGPRLPSWIIGAVVIAVMLRVWLAAALPVETDEAKPLLAGLPLLSGTHDSWLHPPLGRAVALSWVELTGWRPGASALLLRLPFVVASAAGVGLLAAAVHRVSRGASLSCFALVPVLVAPELVTASVLARGYPLVVLATGIVLFCASSPDPTRGRALLCMLAVSVAAWVDLLGGLLIASVPLAWLATHPSRPARLAVFGLALALLVVVAPLVPGAIAVMNDPSLGIGTGLAAGEVMRTQLSVAGIGGGELHRLFAEMTSLMVLGIDSAPLAPLAVALLVLGSWRARSRPDVVVALAFMFVVVLGVGTLRSLRVRNVVELPMLFAFVAAVAIATRKRAASSLSPRPWDEPR